MKERMSEVKVLMHEEKLSKREITYGEQVHTIIKPFKGTSHFVLYTKVYRAV